MTMTRAEQRQLLDEEVWGHADDGPDPDRRGGDADLLGHPAQPGDGDDLPPVDLADEPEWRRDGPNLTRVALACAWLVAAGLLAYQAGVALKEELS